jgi:hypothetical protein
MAESNFLPDSVNHIFVDSTKSTYQQLDDTNIWFQIVYGMVCLQDPMSMSANSHNK